MKRTKNTVRGREQQARLHLPRTEGPLDRTPQILSLGLELQSRCRTVGVFERPPRKGEQEFGMASIQVIGLACLDEPFACLLPYRFLHEEAAAFCPA